MWVSTREDSRGVFVVGQLEKGKQVFLRGPLVRRYRMRWTGVRLAAFWILSATAACASSGSLRTSVIGDVGRALRRLKTLPRPFALGPGIRVEPRSENSSLTENIARRRRDATVVDSANNLFTDHDLVWEVAPGLDMRIFSIKDGFSVEAKPSSTPVCFLLIFNQADLPMYLQRSNWLDADDASFHFMPEISFTFSTYVKKSGRTFGVMRRMKLILLPIVYKLGVITTLLTLLTVFALKGLTLGVLLLVMGSVGLATKFKHYEPAWHASPPGKEVHVHVHGGGSHSHHAPYHADYSDPWSRLGGTSPDYYDSRPILQKGPYNRVGESLWRDSPTTSSTESPWDQFIS